VTDSNLIAENFKSLYPQYSNAVINIESFSNYDDYSLALISSITADKAPDVFVLNNNEKNSIFSNQVI
jgi:ABC-type glycerol-3-phosphate transport system substrate-binding protein